MQQNDSTKPKLQVGRVIFDDPIWRVQTLRNHVGNVTKLVRLWDSAKAQLVAAPDLSETRDALVRSAEIHDMGKPRRFQLVYKYDSHVQKTNWSYSFSGHRFDAQEHEETEWKAYIESLAIMHHEYSVQGITNHIAKLQLDPNIVERQIRVEQTFPLDLYILEMCDQIEATISSSFLNDQEPEARVFMDFQFGDISNCSYWIDPFVFKPDNELSLSIEWVEIEPNAELKNAVEMAVSESYDGYPERRALRNWLVDEALQRAELKTKEVWLKPWTNS